MTGITTSKPLKDAVEVLRRKVPVGSAMSSREWEGVQAEIKMRAMFSARVENERLLAEMQSRLQVRMELARKDGRTMDRGVFIEEMREELRQAGYKRADAKRGSLQDLKSTRRLGLIWDMNLAQAQGYARWKADMTPEGLENEPCYELIRVMDRMERRNWPVIWDQAGGEFFGSGNEDYPAAAGRMIAAKNDPIWTRISRFGTPWPPFDWGSGMGLRGIDRDEAEALGVIGPDDVVQPLDTPFNAETKASLKGVPDDGRQRLAEELQGEVEIVADEIRMVPPPRRVPALPVFPVVIQLAMMAAAEQLATWTEARLGKLLDLLSETVAWKRFKLAIEDAGGDPQDHDALVRALAQFQATTEGREAIRELRNGPLRDAFWCPADFSAVSNFLKGGLA